MEEAGPGWESQTAQAEQGGPDFPTRGRAVMHPGTDCAQFLLLLLHAFLENSWTIAYIVF